MRVETTKSGHNKVWLTDSERDCLVEYYDNEPIKQVAIRLMVEAGLRSDEVNRVTADDLVPSEEADFTRLKVRDSKDGRRRTIVPESLAQQICTMQNILGGGEIVDVTTGTVQDWVHKAAEGIAEETEESDWLKLSAHDLRRSWATGLVYDDVPTALVMEWGGWEDYTTFKEHYWSESDGQIERHLQNIGV